MFLGFIKNDRQTVLVTLMVTTSYDEAVPARTAFFVYIRCRSICDNYNARCESMWARLKDELFYSRNLKSTDFTVAQLKTIIWRYFMSYWNNRRICSSNDGLPPKVKRDRYYAALPIAA